MHSYSDPGSTGRKIGIITITLIDMKRIFLLGVALLTGIVLFAQAPQSFKYQAVARDNSGAVLASANLSFRISIVKGSAGGAAVYTETHLKSTNAFGLVDLEIGNGNPLYGSFAAIDWGKEKYFVSVEMDPSGGNNYQAMGTSQLLSVPYALYAEKVQNNNDADADSTNELQQVTLSNGVLSLSKNGGSVTLPSNLTVGDDWGKQTVTTDSTLSGAGTTALPLKISQRSATVGQVLKWNGTTWKPAADETGTGGSNPVGAAGGDLSGNYPNPLIGDGKVTSAKLADGAVTAAKINQSGAATGQLLKWNGTAWSPADDAFGSTILNLPFSGTTGTNGPAFQVTHTGATDNDAAVYGFASAGTNQTFGVRGISASSSGTGVSGEVSATSGNNTGVYGYSASSSGRGVTGFAGATTGSATGVMGRSSSSEGQGIWGKAEAVTGVNYGVVGSTSSSDGYGVYGFAGSKTGLNYGVYGSSGSSTGVGVFGMAENSSGTTYGVRGLVQSVNGFSGHFSGGKFYVGGNMGIGTENPGTRLEVAGQVKITGGNPGAGKVLTSDASGTATWMAPLNGITLPYSGSASVDTSAFKVINHSADGKETAYALSATITGADGTAIYGNAPASTGLGKAVSGEVTSNDAYSGFFKGGRFYVGGNVGIGTQSPTYKLDVVGNRIRLSNHSGSYVAMRTDESSGYVNLYYSCANLIIQGSAPGENILMLPASNSRVGIRTWTPVYDLDVTGDIRATGSVYYGGTSGSTTATPYPKSDFVFEKTYKLLQTEEVEKFIKREGHLPWVTSVKQEKAENGEVTNMTRMAFETLESVENLQLQIIQQQKLIKALTEENEMLNSEKNQILDRLNRLEKKMSKTLK